MKKYLIVSVWILLASSFGCSLIVDSQAGAGEIDSDSHNDIDTSEKLVPDAPTIIHPAADARVGETIVVEGTGEAGGTVEISLSLGGTALKIVSGEVGEDGKFRFVLSDYVAPPMGSNLLISVVLENEHGSSDAAEIVVKYDPVAISGTISGPSDGLMGVDLHVRLYSSKTDVLEHLDEKVIPIPSTGGDFYLNYEFLAGDGEYFIRAFQDRYAGCGWNGHCGMATSGGDGEPTMSSTANADPQSTAFGPVFVDENTSGTLPGNDFRADNIMTAPFEVNEFEVVTYNESAMPFTPQRWDGGSHIIGKGLCGGYHMYIRSRIYAPGPGPTAQFTPMVQLPNGEEIALIDDGACGDQVADNTSGSYDWWSYDNEFSYGWQNPEDEDAGTYTMYIHDPISDLMHIQVDELFVVKKLSSQIEFLEPDGSDSHPAYGLTMLFRTDSDVKAYQLEVDPANQCCGFFSGINDWWDGANNSFVYDHNGPLATEPDTDTEWGNEPVIDDMPFVIRTTLFDGNPFIGNGAINAIAQAGEHFFVVDDDGNDTNYLSGDIINESGEISAPMRFVLRVKDTGGGFGHLDGTHSTSWLMPGESQYNLAYLYAGNTPEFEIEAFLDVDGTGDPHSPVNRHYWSNTNSKATSANPPWPHLRFGPPVYVDQPAEGEVDVSTTPTFDWPAFESAPSGPWSYILVVDTTNKDGGGGDPDGDGDGPSTVYGLPNDMESFTLGDSEGFDVMQAMLGTPSLAELEPGEQYMWLLLVVECDYPADASQEAAYLGCAGPLFDAQGTGAYATSPYNPFFTGQ